MHLAWLLTQILGPVHWVGCCVPRDVKTSPPRSIQPYWVSTWIARRTQSLMLCCFSCRVAQIWAPASTWVFGGACGRAIKNNRTAFAGRWRFHYHRRCVPAKLTQFADAAEDVRDHADLAAHQRANRTAGQRTNHIDGCRANHNSNHQYETSSTSSQ